MSIVPEKIFSFSENFTNLEKSSFVFSQKALPF